MNSQTAREYPAGMDRLTVATVETQYQSTDGGFMVSVPHGPRQSFRSLDGVVLRKCQRLGLSGVLVGVEYAHRDYGVDGLTLSTYHFAV